jgi:hypothetical protein
MEHTHCEVRHGRIGRIETVMVHDEDNVKK